MGISSEDPELGKKLAAEDPITIPNTGYYRDHIRAGSLIPADRASAEVSGVKVFTDPKKLIPALEASAIKAFNSNYAEDGAFEYFRDERVARAAKLKAKEEEAAKKSDGKQADPPSETPAANEGFESKEASAEKLATTSESTSESAPNDNAPTTTSRPPKRSKSTAPPAPAEQAPPAASDTEPQGS
jgi:hypothetical protein